MALKDYGERYDSPKTHVIVLSTEGVLCSSDKNGFYMDPMDILDGDKNPWGWDE